MKKKYIDIISGVVLMLFSLWGWYETSTWKESAAAAGVSVKTYPRAVFAFIFICGAIIFVRTLIKMMKKDEGVQALLNKVTEMHLVKVAVVVALMIIYIIALKAVGFLLTTPVFLFVSMWFFGERNWKKVAIISIAGTLVLYLFFVEFMNVNF